MRRRRIARAAGAVAAIATLALAALAVGAPSNGGFERGNLSGWQVRNGGDGAWRVYSVDDLAFAPQPPQGRFAAIATQDGPGTRILHRKLKLRKNHRIKLSFYVFYENDGERFWTPRHLNAPDESSPPNQQYRIDLLRRKAPLKSLRERDILKTLFRTKVGDPNRLEPKRLTFNLTRFAGRTVTLRFAEADNQGPLYAGTDAVRLVQTKKRNR